MTEWREVSGTDGLYSVSDEGQVKSRARARTSGGVLKSWLDHFGYVRVSICIDGKPRQRRVHHLVLEAFVGPRPERMECRHLDGDPANNRLDNLAWGTASENAQDNVRHKTHHSARKTHCIHGHPFDETNTYVPPAGGRVCRECVRRRGREYWHRKARN